MFSFHLGVKWRVGEILFITIPDWLPKIYLNNKQYMGHTRKWKDLDRGSLTVKINMHDLFGSRRQKAHFFPP